jgi:tetratricopeptide (TPR) repeat protein
VGVRINLRRKNHELRPKRIELYPRSADQSTVVEAELLDSLRRRKSFEKRQCSWRAVATGEGARERALADIAAQIIVGLQKSTFTDNWQSLKAYQEGLRIIRRKVSGSLSDDLAEAQPCWERAVAYDPANWIARFYLAQGLCHEARPATALRHFSDLNQMLTRSVRDPLFLELVQRKLDGAEHRRSGFHTTGSQPVDRVRRIAKVETSPRSRRVVALLQHLVDFPECPFILHLNMAIALSDLRQTSGARESSAAQSGVGFDPIQSLRMIAHFDRKEPIPSSQSGLADLTVFSRCKSILGLKKSYELSLYAKGVLAHVLSTDSTIGPQESVAELRVLAEEIDGICSAARRIDNRIDNWRTLETAGAVARASLARRLSADKALIPNREARKYFYEAIAAEPNLVDGYLLLAKLYMRWRTRFAENWTERAESLLRRAAELNPTCQETKMALADLFSMPEVGRLDKATFILRRMPRSPQACLRLANLIIKVRLGTYPDALKYLREHVRLTWAFSTEAAECYHQLVELCQVASERDMKVLGSIIELLNRIKDDADVGEADKIRIRSAIDTWVTVVRPLRAEAGA